jgi:hypothetical protein
LTPHGLITGVLCTAIAAKEEIAEHDHHLSERTARAKP